MIDIITPVNVKYYAVKKENENYAFRLFLKEHAVPEELDRQFHDLHNELFSGYECKYCRNCCKEYFEKPCRNLQQDNTCALGTGMPDDCKNYPYTDLPDRLGSMLNTIEIASICPVVYEMLERLKVMYGFAGKTAERYMDIIDDSSDDSDYIDEELEMVKAADPVWYLSYCLDNVGYGDSTYDDACVMAYDELWQDVKAAIIAEYPDKKPKPEQITSKSAGYAPYFKEIIQDIENALQNSREYEKRVNFCRDVIELFDLDEPGFEYAKKNFYCAIGESLSDSGKIQESDIYYEKIIRDFNQSGYVIANYILTLEKRGDMKKAKELLEKYVSPDMELNEDTEMLLERAREIYLKEGDLEKCKLYEKLQKKYNSRSYVSQAKSNLLNTPMSLRIRKEI